MPGSGALRHPGSPCDRAGRCATRPCFEQGLRKSGVKSICPLREAETRGVPAEIRYLRCWPDGDAFPGCPISVDEAITTAECGNAGQAHWRRRDQAGRPCEVGSTDMRGLEAGEHDDANRVLAGKSALPRTRRCKSTISVDCRKKELVGGCKNGGRGEQARGQETSVNVYDSLSLADGKATLLSLAAQKEQSAHPPVYEKYNAGGSLSYRDQ